MGGMTAKRYFVTGPDGEKAGGYPHGYIKVKKKIRRLMHYATTVVFTGVAWVGKRHATTS